MLFPRVWAWLLAGLWIVCMAFSRTVLSAHWLSDTIGGMLIGAGVTLVVGGLLLGWARSPQADSPRTVGDTTST